jgi:chromate transporter
VNVLWTIVCVFARIGLGAFGGGLATIPFIHFELVVSRSWLSERAFTEVVSLAQMTPGPIAVNAATFVGYRLAGVPGAVLATFSVIAAPLLLIMSALFLLSRASGTWKKRVEQLQRSLRPVVSGMLFAAFWVVLRPLVSDWRLWIMTAGIFLFSKFSLTRRYPQLLLLIAGLLGICLL